MLSSLEVHQYQKMSSLVHFVALIASILPKAPCEFERSLSINSKKKKEPNKKLPIDERSGRKQGLVCLCGAFDLL